MKRTLLAAALAALLLAPAVAQANAQFVIDFEKTWDFSNGDVNGYYGGGTAADGSSGSNLGASFVGVSGLSNDASFTYYSGAPSPQGVAYAHTFAAGDVATLNVADGVSGALAFYFASPAAVSGAVKAYSGLDGSGALLGSFDLPANSSSAYDNWSGAWFAFAGLAHSFDLTASANLVAFDNITAVPEPAPAALVLGGVAMLALITRRRRG